MKPRKPLRPTVNNTNYTNENQSENTYNTYNQNNNIVNNNNNNIYKGKQDPFSNVYKSTSTEDVTNKNEYNNDIKNDISNNQLNSNQTYNFIKNNNNNISNNNNNKINNNNYSHTPQQYKKTSIQEESTPIRKDNMSKFNPYTNSATSQSHKRLVKEYKINPKVIPRPNYFDEVYKNENKQYFYSTNSDLLPPQSNTFFIANETENSNPKFIRSTLSKIPNDPSVITSSNLNFGLVVSPFSELLSNYQENEPPKVEAEEGIFRCKRCEAYINNKFKIDYSNNYKKIAVCNLCGNSNELNPNNRCVKDSYTSSVESCPELSLPSIDFIAPKNFKDVNLFKPHYMFMIDISNVALEYGVPSYVRLFVNLI